MTAPFNGLFRDGKATMNNLSAALASSDWTAGLGYVVRCHLLDCMKLFWRIHGRGAAVIHLTASLERVLQDHFDSEFGVDSKHRLLLREETRLFGCSVVFDAEQFELE